MPTDPHGAEESEHKWVKEEGNVYRCTRCGDRGEVDERGLPGGPCPHGAEERLSKKDERRLREKIGYYLPSPWKEQVLAVLTTLQQERERADRAVAHINECHNNCARAEAAERDARVLRKLENRLEAERGQTPSDHAALVTVRRWIAEAREETRKTENH